MNNNDDDDNPDYTQLKKSNVQFPYLSDTSWVLKPLKLQSSLQQRVMN